MKTSILDYIIKTGLTEWQPLLEEGINTNGIYVKILRIDDHQH